MMNYPIKKIIWVAAAVAVVVLLAMFVIPVISALLLGFFGVCALLAASRWIAGVFNKNEPVEDKYDTNYQDDASGRSFRRPARIGRTRQEIEDAEVIKDESSGRKY